MKQLAMERADDHQARRRVVVDSSGGGGGGGGGGGFAMRSRHMSLNSSSLNQLLPNHQYFGPISHYNLQQQQQMSYWASLPPASLQFPPLLPLPTKATRSTEKQAKPVNQRKGSGSSQGRVERKVKEEEEECIYSLSPPPSDLPLPSFVLTMQKNKGVAVEAAAGDAR
ncbi:uncharacterized protein LOC122052848 [Zingiber officinale]|uniref:uncharacterized protein LOC122052848 n=1 Tax=Zingiber officinale TaxID=94328 RepID=UPI001C4B6C61|nr:uncharacterized protein LOC122052848 [Zingiber officinale]